jgi:ribonuclease HII
MPSFLIEKRYAGPIAGIDEAGRGPLAGPVVAACVHIPEKFPALKKVKDSKKLDHLTREALFTEITRSCAFGIAVADVEEINSLNILHATFLAMRRAADAMHLAFQVPVGTFLVDGNQRPRGMEAHNIVTLIEGDDKSYSIACASILAKVTRDRLMCQLHEEYPHYGWADNKGYGTPEHMEALMEYGPCAHHRREYAPVAQAHLRFPEPLKRQAKKG